MAPLLTHVTDVVAQGKDPSIEHFCSKAFVEAFDVRVPIQFAGLDEVEVNVVPPTLCFVASAKNSGSHVSFRRGGDSKRALAAMLRHDGLQHRNAGRIRVGLRWPGSDGLYGRERGP